MSGDYYYYIDPDVDIKTAEKLCMMVADAIQHERARVRREEVEPLREAPRAAVPAIRWAVQDVMGSEVDYGFASLLDNALTALRAADERGR